MKRAFLDLDGTLLNSKERHCNVLRDVLIQYGFGNRQVLDFVEYKANGKTRDNIWKMSMDFQRILQTKSVQLGSIL